VLINVLSFDDDLMERVVKRAEGMRVGTYLLSVTKMLPITEGEAWSCLISIVLPMSWGPSTVHVYKKL
jgi:hypothetical protein